METMRRFNLLISAVISRRRARGKSFLLEDQRKAKWTIFVRSCSRPHHEWVHSNVVTFLHSIYLVCHVVRRRNSLQQNLFASGRKEKRKLREKKFFGPESESSRNFLLSSNWFSHSIFAFLPRPFREDPAKILTFASPFHAPAEPNGKYVI